MVISVVYDVFFMPLQFVYLLLKCHVLVHISGRRITSSGQRDLDQVAGRIVVAAP